MNISIEDYEINIPDGLVKEWATENGWVQGGEGEGSLRRQLSIAGEALEIKDQLCEALRDKVDKLEQRLKEQELLDLDDLRECINKKYNMVCIHQKRWQQLLVSEKEWEKQRDELRDAHLKLSDAAAIIIDLEEELSAKV